MNFTPRMMGDNRTSGMLDLQQGSVMAEASRLNSQTQWARMKTKKRVPLFVAVVLAAALIVMGIVIASGAEQYEVKPAQFKVNGTFCYPELTWGMSVTETAYKLPVAISQEEGAISGDYIAGDSVKLGGEDGQVIVTFEQGRLETVSLRFRPEEDAQAWFEEQMAAFTGQFGEPAQRLDSAEENLTTTGAVWDSYDGSSLQLVLITGGSEATVVLTVGR